MTWVVNVMNEYFWLILFLLHLVSALHVCLLKLVIRL